MKFYKKINNEWIGSTNVYNKDYTLLLENKDDYNLPIDGWDWYDISPTTKTEFELWEERLATISDLKQQGQESLLAIPISAFYAANQTAISEFIKDGSADFLLVAKMSDEVWLDMRTAPDKDSPREILINALTPLTI